MSSPRGRRSRDSRVSPLERRKRSRKLNPAQKKLFRKLLNILGEIIDEKGHFSTDDDAISAILEDTDTESESEEKKGVYIEVAREASRQPLFLQGGKANEMKEASEETKNILHFSELCESHSQLTDQIRGSLNALGGGGRTAKALERMHATIDGIVKTCFTVDGEKVQRFDTSTFKTSLDACRHAASEVREAFKELGVYNKVLFDILGKIMDQLQAIATKFHLEYSAYSTCCADQYLDDVFEPLVKYFDSFINELTNIADKEIAAIRQAQDFRSQRYLNLTTVATFLSSVTVSTLQITADDGVSSLASVTNTLWLISLVFSTASAVYSLLMMTWRQSSVCQPNLALPSFLDIWFRNGPMYALIVAVMTFSIGSCLLAFHIADEQGVLVSAVVPTAFAGIHAYGIFIFSVWFLLEQWKDKHTESWRRINDVYLGPFRKSVRYGTEMIKEYVGQATTQIQKMRAATRNWCETLWSRRVVLPSADAAEFDVEPGFVFDSFNALAPESPCSVSERTGEETDVPGSVQADIVQAIPEGTPDATEEEEEEEEEAKYIPFENLLHFSPDGFLLACAHGNNVTVYDVEDQFNVLTIITTPLGDQVKQISWNPGRYGYGRWQRSNHLAGDLLVRSSESVSCWSIRRSESTKLESSLMGVLKEAVLFVRWTGTEDAGVEVRLFNVGCKELRSFEIAKMREISRVSHALLFRNRFLICLTDDRDHSSDCLLIVDPSRDTVQSTYPVHLGHSSMSVSSDSKKILLHGSNAGVQIAELSISESGEDLSISITEDYLLWDRTHFDEEMTEPEATAAFHGADDKMIIGYSANEVVVLYRWSYNFSALHIFSTPTTDAILEIPMSFTVNRGPESDPYMLAFSDECGSVMIWSIQSNNQLSECPSARTFAVHDRRNGRKQDPTIRTGKFLLLTPPTSS